MNTIEIQKIPLEERPTIIAADGLPLEIIGRTTQDIQFNAISCTEFRSETYICKQLLEDLILGMDFLEDNSVILNFRDGTATIDNSTIELPSKKDIDQNDRQVRNKFITNNCHVIKTLNESMSTKGKTLNINSIYHKIATKKDKIISKKQYPVPMKYISKVKDEIQKLESANIIRNSFEVGYYQNF